jgi:type IV secretion system protein VirB5
MNFPFCAPAKPYAPTPADTPYRRAQQEWDARMGSAVLSARTWRRMAFAALGLSAALGIALTAVALQRRRFVHVVEVAPEGQELSVRTAGNTWTPTEAQTAYFIGHFVRLTRSLPTDPIVLRENWLEAYRFLTPQAATQLNDIARQDDPFARVGTTGRIVHVRSIVQRSEGSWQVALSE